MNRQIKTYTKTIIVISSLISIGLVLFIAFSANYYISKMSSNNTALYNAYHVSELMKTFKNNINILDNKQRGYLITGDGKLLEAFKQKETETKTCLKSMEMYFLDKPEAKEFNHLKNLTYQKLLEVKDIGSYETWSHITQIQENGIKTMHNINQSIDTINYSLNQSTKVLLDNSIKSVQISKKWSYLEIVLGILTALAAVIILIHDINTRNRLQQDLRIAKKRADDNASFKEQFLANMSHEIRTPLNAVLGFSDLLEKTHLNTTQINYLEAIKSSSSNLLNIINDILDFSKIEAGQLHIEQIPFNTLELLNSIKLIFEQKAISKGVAFQLHIENHFPEWLSGDPTRLNQILTNVISNAIKFTHHGTVSLICQAQETTQNTVLVTFTIKDTGIGISADRLTTIFERFTQGDLETTRKYGGSGLGLAIVKQLVNIQGGKITLTSKENEGTEFVISMNYHICDSTPSFSSQLHHQPFKIASSHPFKVLLVEDNELNQKLASTYLKGFGLEVDLAENGQIAIDSLQHKTYDVIIMDIQMPILDGYQTSEKIRKELHLTLPIIGMTANIMPDALSKCLKYGMNDYITKPFREFELYNIVKKYVFQSNHVNKYDDKKISLSEKKTTDKFINKTHLLDLSRGNKAFTIEIIELFLKQTPEQLDAIETAIIRNDYKVIQALSHKLKTSVGFMSVRSLLEKLTSMETMALQNEAITDIQSLFNEIKSISQSALLELKNFSDSLENKTDDLI